jgi:hypothetical protein
MSSNLSNTHPKHDITCAMCPQCGGEWSLNITQFGRLTYSYASKFHWAWPSNLLQHVLIIGTLYCMWGEIKLIKAVEIWYLGHVCYIIE